LAPARHCSHDDGANRDEWNALTKARWSNRAVHFASRAWRSEVLPTRGEAMRKGSSVQPRRVGAVLELVKPCLAVLKDESRPTRDDACPAGASR
jgi:hypothetical protein